MGLDTISRAATVNHTSPHLEQAETFHSDIRASLLRLPRFFPHLPCPRRLPRLRRLRRNPPRGPWSRRPTRTSAGTINSGMSYFVLTTALGQPGMVVMSTGYPVPGRGKETRSHTLSLGCQVVRRKSRISWVACYQSIGQICGNLSVVAGQETSITLLY